MYRPAFCSRLFPLAILASLLISACGNTPAQAPSLWSNSDIGGAPDISDDSDAEVAGTTSCISSAECSEPNKVCDPLTKACVACLYDPDCAAGSHCQAKACMPFKTCSNSLDCKSALGPGGAEQAVCDQAIGECVECASNNDCPANSECMAKRCAAYITCGNSSDCPTNQVCDPSSKRCAECAAPEDCPANQTCEAGQCKGFTTCSSDKQCTPLGLLCDKAKGKCAQCVSHADCPAVYHCSVSGVDGTGECKLDVCKAGAGSCQDNGIVACNAEGSGYDAPEMCGPQTTCAVDSSVPACKPWLCQAGFSCVGDKAVQCRADGLEVLAETDCAANGQNCLAGECKALLCQPKQAYCDGNTVKLCDETGMASAVQKICTSKEYCNAGACKTGVCPPGQPVCDGNVAKVCNAQGSAFQGPGKNCGSSAVCVSGACVPKVCPAGGSFCEGNVVKVCDALGLSASAQKTCGSNEFCNDGACKAQVCAPSQPACDGNVAKVCNAQGSGYSGASTHCASKKCIAGVCSAMVCQPATMFCESGKLKTCSPDGLSVVADQACATGSYCGLNKSGDAACLAWVCEPGKATCNGTVATTCKADGSGYQDAGTECKVQGKVCSAGVCKALLCDPQTPNYCDQNTAMKCDATGLSPSTVQVCGSGQYCDKGACQAQVCSPGKPGCSGELASTCNGNGSGYLAGGTDCKAVGKSCSGGVCVAQVCGNGVVEGTETCDDGNTLDGDGCTANCACVIGDMSACGTCDTTCNVQKIGATSPLKWNLNSENSTGLTLTPMGDVTLDTSQISLKLKFLWAANSPQNTVSKVDCKTIKEVGRYPVCQDPSRTSVDLDGNVFVACRGDARVAKIAAEMKDCIDKNGNGKIDTSSDINGDGSIQTNEMVANDECVLFIVQPLGPGSNTAIARGAAVDKNNNVYIGFWSQGKVAYVDGKTGATLKIIDWGCGSYGLVVDQKGHLWGQGSACGNLMMYNPTTDKFAKVASYGSAGVSPYGINVDGAGRIWLGGSPVSRYNPVDGTWLKCSSSCAGLATSNDGMVYLAKDSGGIGKIDGENCQDLGTVQLAGHAPHGVGIDFDGFVWGINWTAGHSVDKIDPGPPKGKIGALIGTRGIGNSPYTYSDMTGYTLNYFTAPKGQYTAVLVGGLTYDPATASQVWQTLTAEADLPEGTALRFRLRAGNSKAELEAAKWSEPIIFPPAIFPYNIGPLSLVGNMLQVEVQLTTSDKKLAPVLKSLSAKSKLI